MFKIFKKMYTYCYDIWYHILSFLQNSIYEFHFALSNKFFYNLYLNFTESKTTYLDNILVEFINNDEDSQISEFLNTNINKYNEIIFINYYKLWKYIDIHLLNFHLLQYYNIHNQIYLENIELHQIEQIVDKKSALEYALLTNNVEVVVENLNLNFIRATNINAIGGYECIKLLYIKDSEISLHLLINAFNITYLTSTLLCILKNKHCNIHHINDIIYNNYINCRCNFCRNKNIQLCFEWISQNSNKFYKVYKSIVVKNKNKYGVIDNILKMMTFCKNETILLQLFKIESIIYMNCTNCIKKCIERFVYSDNITGLNLYLQFNRIVNLDNHKLSLILQSQSIYNFLYLLYVKNDNLLRDISKITSLKLISFFEKNNILSHEYINKINKL